MNRTIFKANLRMLFTCNPRKMLILAFFPGLTHLGFFMTKLTFLRRNSRKCQNLRKTHFRDPCAKLVDSVSIFAFSHGERMGHEFAAWEPFGDFPLFSCFLWRAPGRCRVFFSALASRHRLTRDFRVAVLKYKI